MTSRFERTTAVIRERGHLYWKTEYWNSFSKTKVDLFNIIDLVVLVPGFCTLGIQVCGSDFQDHVRKITEEFKENALAWLLCPGNQLELWGWRQVKKKRGGKAMVWKPRVLNFQEKNGDIVYEEY